MNECMRIPVCLDLPLESIGEFLHVLLLPVYEDDVVRSHGLDELKVTYMHTHHVSSNGLDVYKYHIHHAYHTNYTITYTHMHIHTYHRYMRTSIHAYL